MAVPKRKTSKAKSRSRQSANFKLNMPGMTACPNCGEMILAHRVCKNCGQYAGKTIIQDTES